MSGDTQRLMHYVIGTVIKHALYMAQQIEDGAEIPPKEDKPDD